MTLLGAIYTRVIARPLILAQMFASAAGALGMVMGASAMSSRDFDTFSLLTLATILCTSAARGLLFQPALIETRHNKNAHIHVRVALLGAVCASIGFVAAAAVLGVHEPLWLAILSIANMLPVMTEWLRSRGMALNQRWHVARGDAIRLAATLPGALVLMTTTEPEVFFLFIMLSYIPTVIYLAWRLPRVSTHLSPLHFWRPASSQLAEIMMAHSVDTIPLLVLAGFGSSNYIGGVRMAQTLLGPINLVLSIGWTNLLADGATQDSHSKPVNLIRHGRRLAAVVSLVSMALITLVLLLLRLTNFDFRGVDNRSMTVGVLLVGMLASTSGFGWIDALIMRLLGHHTAATVGRALLVAVTGAGYALGYLLGGVDASLVAGFACAAVANPLVFVLPASVLYRRYRLADARA